MLPLNDNQSIVLFVLGGLAFFVAGLVKGLDDAVEEDIKKRFDSLLEQIDLKGIEIEAVRADLRKETFYFQERYSELLKLMPNLGEQAGEMFDLKKTVSDLKRDVDSLVSVNELRKLSK